MKFLHRTDSLEAEHPELTATAQRLVALLEALRSALGSTDGQSVWSHHMQFAERAGMLADHLRAAIELTNTHVASAFVVLRTALEHASFDELVLLADRYEQSFKAEAAAFEELKDEFESGSADWTKGVVVFERTKKGARLVRVGHPVKNDEGDVVEQVSPYYRVLKHHDAMLGPARSQDELAGPFSDPDRLRERASENSGLYRDYLRWSSLVENLRLNDRIEERESLQLEVHYRFLSAYVHATATGYDYVHRGRAGLIQHEQHWHAITELALLYVCSVGISELRSFVEFADRRPRLTLDNCTEIAETCNEASELTGYLWFPRIGEPTEYDSVQEANRRAYRDRAPGGWRRPAEHPQSIPIDELSYYPDPLKRLVALHTGGIEMTTRLEFPPLW